MVKALSTSRSVLAANMSTWLGFDFGDDGARTMMLVYGLPATEAIYQRFIGIDGSAYFVGGLGMTALTFNQYRCRSNSLRDRSSAWCQCRLSEIYADRDLEPVLSVLPHDARTCCNSRAARVEIARWRWWRSRGSGWWRFRGLCHPTFL